MYTGTNLRSLFDLQSINSYFYHLMAKRISRRFHIRKVKHAPPGTTPGTIRVPEGALQPVIRCFVTWNDGYEEKELKTFDAVKTEFERDASKNYWFDIRGVADKEFFERLADYFHIHRLEMEDVFNFYQRPKMEEHPEHLFMVSRELYIKDNCLSNEQLSLFLGKNYVITIQDKYEDMLEPVRLRIRQGRGFIRKNGSDYMAYAITDAVIDNYYPLLEKIGDRLEDLEEELIENPTRQSMNKILAIKRELITFRRSIWPERDKINDILRSNLEVVRSDAKIFFRDSYDHCIQLLDIVESYKEITASLMDVYLSSVSNKLNQVIKVLTIISTIFIPLTFIVGLYGMNFQHYDPKTGDVIPGNMAELYTPYGYVGVLVIMAIIVIFQLYFFFKKGWLTSGTVK